jgi:CHASE2 domain-containing sensor protein
MWRFAHPPKEKMFWWYEHLQGMMASYIAAWTAFLVVTVGRFVHAWWLWIVPTAIGVPAITLTTVYYKRKFLPKQKVAA